ncbi:hypothetical protein [Chitinophaga solisilvae]|uniref:hypothetical protein n=1 Tax=Chitinophaga solisilvae TaxID=1233460 RepID=UPI00136F7A1E|nr:hypothetical protein [Chitinophaga solisilvae]
MKKFLQKVCLLVLPLLALMYPLDKLLSAGLKRVHGEGGGDIGELEVMRDIYDGKINSDIVIYGSSRAWIQINSSILEDSLKKQVYNLGIDGHNFHLQYMRHRELLKHNRKPQMIVLSVDIFSLQRRADLYEYSQFMPYMLWNENMYNFTSTYQGFNKTDYFIPLMRYAGKTEVLDVIVRNLTHDIPDYRTKGFRGMHADWNDDFDNARKTGVKYTIHYDTASIRLFEQFIRECKKDNIQLVTIYAPEYIEGQQFIAGRADLFNLYRRFFEKYHIPFLDFTNDELCFDKKYFYNSMHLNYIGADLFTSKLAHRLKALQTDN